MSATGPADGASVLDALAARARLSPHDPWLFYRDGWDWRWRSFRQVADQVARGAAVVRRRFPEPGARIAFFAGQDPDAIAAGLAIQAAGGVPVAVGSGIEEAELSCDAWAVAGEGPAGGPAAARADHLDLPAARSQMDRTPLEPLEPASAAGTLAPRDLTAAARRLDAILCPAGNKTIVCAAPGVDVRAAQLIQAWTLVRGAAWVLEPLAEAFTETVLWARPNVVFGRARDLSPLAERMKNRKHRRQSRLEVLAVAGGGAAGPEPWRDLGIRIVALEDSLPAAADPD